MDTKRTSDSHLSGFITLNTFFGRSIVGVGGGWRERGRSVGDMFIYQETGFDDVWPYGIKHTAYGAHNARLGMNAQDVSETDTSTRRTREEEYRVLLYTAVHSVGGCWMVSMEGGWEAWWEVIQWSIGCGGSACMCGRVAVTFAFSEGLPGGHS